MIFNEKKKSVIYYENINIGNRIRDIIQSPDGRIVLLTDYLMRENVPELIFLAKCNTVKCTNFQQKIYTST